MKQIISAGAVIFRRDHEGAVKFLLLYHGRNYWNFPKGKLEQGERAVNAFLREVEEETGLRHQDLRILPGFRTSERFTFVDRYPTHPESKASGGARPKVFKIVLYYLVESRKREVVISEEHEGFGWFTFAEAMRITKYPNTKEVLKRAHDFIRSSLHRHPAHPKGQGRHVR